MHRHHRFIAAFGALWIAASLHAQQDFSQVEIKTHPVAKNIYMLEGSGGNIGVSVGDDGMLIVDDQFAPLADKIKAALNKLGEGKLKFVLNTHHHGDHTGGNPVFGKEAHIVAHTKLRERLAAVASTPKEALPVITFDESLSVHFNGEEIRARHYPAGHTDNDAIIFFTGANVVHMGDHFFNGRFPFIDLAGGGSVDGYIKNVGDVIAEIEKMPSGVKIIPGHGPLATIEDLKTFHAALKETTEIVRKQMKEGKTAQEIQAAGLPEKYKDWGSGFVSTERWIGTIVRAGE